MTKTKLDEISERIQKCDTISYREFNGHILLLDILKDLVEEVKRVDQSKQDRLDDAIDDANLRDKRRADDAMADRRILPD